MKISARELKILICLGLFIPAFSIIIKFAHAQTDEGFSEPETIEVQETIPEFYEVSPSEGTTEFIIDPNISSTLNNISKQKEEELKTEPLNYENLIQYINGEFQEISQQYESYQDKNVSTEATSVEELSALTSLTLARYLVLNKYLFESRIVLEESLDLLDKSGFDKVRILNQIDQAYAGVITNQADLAAFSYILGSINNNPEDVDDYYNYIMKTTQDMEDRYQESFEEIERIIEVSLF